jgi:hypothetical protein
LFMDLEETEARNDCAGEGQQQFSRPTVGGHLRQSPLAEAWEAEEPQLLKVVA